MSQNLIYNPAYSRHYRVCCIECKHLIRYVIINETTCMINCAKHPHHMEVTLINKYFRLCCRTKAMQPDLLGFTVCDIDESKISTKLSITQSTDNISIIKEILCE